ncbi:MAG: hypothetical protein U5K74_08675 [Gemmatimonadaceae bacterium]|nr:hypothetical protein [Gemmatimonadaceae bacterium]
MATGARGIVQTWAWSTLEPDSARLNVQQLIADVRYARSRGLTVLLGIQPINTVKREVPSDLVGVAWDDPRMLRRFDRLLDALAPILGDVTYLSVGNEVAEFLTRAAQWPAYTTFLSQVVTAAHRRAPALKVGATLEYVGAASSTATSRALIAVSDVAIFTLYPFNPGGFTVAPPTVSGVLFDNMLTLAGDRQVVLQELGYPASPTNGSSEAQQAAFFTDAIAQWRARSARMPFASLFLLHDFTPQQCADFEAILRTCQPAATVVVRSARWGCARWMDRARLPSVRMRCARRRRGCGRRDADQTTRRAVTNRPLNDAT